MKVHISQQIDSWLEAEVDIPGVRSWRQIKDWYINWDTLHYTLDGKEWKEITLDSREAGDHKKPIRVIIHATGFKKRLAAVEGCGP